MLSPMHRGASVFDGEVVTFAGRLLTVSRKRAAEVVARLGGIVEPDLTARTTLVVVGAETAAVPETEAERRPEQETDRKLRRATERAQQPGAPIRIVNEETFCDRAGLLTPSALKAQYYSSASIRGMYPSIHEEHLRYLEKWALLRAVVRTPGDTWY